MFFTKGKDYLLVVNTNDPDDGSILRDEMGDEESAHPFMHTLPKEWDEDMEDATNTVHPAVSDSEPTSTYGNITSRYIPAYIITSRWQDIRMTSRNKDYFITV